MKPTFIPSTLALGVALGLIPLTSTFAQSAWTNVDEFMVGASGVNLGLAAVDNGVVFSAGSGNDLAGVPHAFIRRSLDSGQTWQTVCDLPGNGTALSWAVTVGLHSGLVFATATLRSPQNATRNDWVTLRSADGGSTWIKVDVLTSPNFKCNPNAVVEDPAGRVFVAGYFSDARNGDHFLIRRSLDGGTTWTTVDNQVPSGGPNQATSLAATPAGVFAAGWLRNVWTVRRSTDGGTTWKTVDSFLAAPTGYGYYSHARGITADASGTLYVTGHSQFLVNKVTDLHWITRKSTDNGATWRTVDDTLGGSNSGFGYAVTVDALGRVFATGTYATVSGSTATNHWVTRASVDGGASWVTTDDYIALGGALGSAAASDAVGNVFTAGKAKTALGNPTAVVRKLAAP